MSWIRLAASCRYLNSFSGSTPSAREGELASCSLVKYQRRCGPSSLSAAIFEETTDVGRVNQLRMLSSHLDVKTKWRPLSCYVSYFSSIKQALLGGTGHQTLPLLASCHIYTEIFTHLLQQFLLKRLQNYGHLHVRQ